MMLQLFKRKMMFYPRFFLLGAFLFLTNNEIFAQGDLLISPLRIVFEGNKKSEEINLANVGKDTANYVISVIDIRMKEDGSFEQVVEPDSGQNFAGKFIRFFPRRVTLAPNEAQVVKIQLIKTSEMTPGEYRSHLYFRSVPDEKPLGETNTKKDTSGLSVHLVPIFGITTPVIIRVGENTTQVTLSDLSFRKPDSVRSAPQLKLTFNRNGSMSIYGDLKIDHVLPSGKTTQVKLVKGIGVYAPNPRRQISIDLDAENINYSKGKLHLTYTLQTSDKSVKTVEADLILQ